MRHRTMLLSGPVGLRIPWPQTQEGGAVDWLLKGPEYKLGDGTLFVDKEGFARASVRAKW